MALPALTVLRQQLPASRISVFVGDHSASVFRRQPVIDEVVAMPDEPSARTVLPLAVRLRTYDCVLLLDRSRYLRTAVKMSGARSRSVVVANRREMRHESEVYLDTLATLQLAVPAPPPLPRLETDPSVADEAQTLIAPVDGPYVVLHPGGATNPGARMLEKRWPQDRFAALGRALRERGYRVVLSGGPGDLNVIESLKGSLKGVISVAGRADLRLTAEVVRGAALFVGPDTGMSHIAGAVGTPVVAIFGPTNPQRYRPLGERVEVLAPTASWEIEDRDLRLEATTTNLPSTSEISVDDVLAACERLLGRTAISCSPV